MGMAMQQEATPPRVPRPPKSPPSSLPLSPPPSPPSPAPPQEALVCVQAFPPLLKNAGGVAKRYISLCRALIDGLGWNVTILTPVDVAVSGEEDVDRWLADGSLVHLRARGFRMTTVDGVVVVLDLFSFVNSGHLVSSLCMDQRKLHEEGRLSLSTSRFSLIFVDDCPWRASLLLLARAAGVPTVVTSHTDGSKLRSYHKYPALKLVWHLHIWSAHLSSVHASVSRIFGQQMRADYGVPVNGIWPPILWAKEFRSAPDEFAARAAEQRQLWLELLRQQGLAAPPRAILLFAGRWSLEKRIELLLDAVPDGAALVIVGDGTSGHAQEIANAGPAAGRPHVLALRKMLGGSELRVAYAAADLFCSASNFETLGNTLIESWCAGTPCAVQPAQGHLEFVQDGRNGWFVDYDEPAEAKAALTRIVAGGLDARRIAERLPELAAFGTRLRTSDFAREFEQAVIRPALAVRAAQRARGPLRDGAMRLLALCAWALSWLVLRLITRTVFALSKEPKYEILGKLGGAVESKPPLRSSVRDAVRKFRDAMPVIRTPPCAAAMDPSTAALAAEAPVAAPRATADDSDYESHFKGEKGDPWMEKVPALVPGSRRRRPTM